MAQLRHNYLLILVILMMKSHLFPGHEKQVEFSVQPSVYADNNIFERIHQNKTTDQYLQVLISGKYNNRIKSNHINIQYLGNWQNHMKYSQENKLFNRLDLSFNRHLSSRQMLFLNGQIYRKNWIQNDRHYTSGFMNVGMVLKGSTVSYQMDLHAGNCRFSYFSEFDNNHLGLVTKMTIPQSRHVSLNFAVEGNYYQYMNNFIDRRRYDSNGILSMGFEYRKNLIVGANLQAFHQTSNYNFLVNNTVIISPYLSAETGGFYIQILAKYQFKQYLNKLTNNQISLVYPDPESNINNQVFIGIEREVRKNISLSGKIMFFSSEYKYQADFYEKLLIGVGLKYNL